MKLKSFLTLLLAFFVHVSFAQEKTVKGNVSDESGPLPGVTVIVKGTSRGTQTDFEGNYQIKASPGEVILFSYVGYGTVEKEVGSLDTIDVVLQSANLLEEIVVTGVAVGTSAKKLGFSLAKVDEASLQTVPAGDPANALRGKVAGVRVVSASGNPTTGAAIRLRGSTSISGSQSPLIIVDGIITSGSLTDIAVEDIQSMEVIKGAAASSLYGSLAGNGVIQIITKKGSGKMQVSVKGEYGWSDITNDYPLSSVHGYALDPAGVRMGDWDNDPTTPQTSNFGFDLSTGNRILDPDGLFDNPYSTPLIDNVDNIFSNQPFQTYTGTISGSDQKMRYYLSAQHQETEGVLEPVSPFVRNAFRANFDVQATDKLSIKFNGSMTDRKGENITEQGQGANYFYSALVVEPFIDFTEKTEDGLYSNNPAGYEVQGSNFQNPLYVAEQRTNVFDSRRYLLGAEAKYDFSESFNMSAQQTLDQTNTEGYSYTPKGFVTPTPNANLNNGQIQRSETERSTLVSSLQANYFKDFGDINFSTSFKYLFEKRELKNLSAGGYDLFVDGVYTIQNTPLENRNQSSYYAKEIARNYFLTADIDYQDKLILNLLGRRDESSLFGSNERNKYYGRGSLAYRLSEDVEMNGIQEFKIRAAYGSAGQRPPAFNAQYETFTVTSNGIFPGQFGNEDLKPSVSAELELGLNIDFLDRFSFEMNYSDTKTTDAHVQVPLSGVAGFSNQWQNIGEIKSQYFEVSLGGDIMRKADFNWSFNINFDTGNQEITDLNGVPAFTRSGLGAVDIFRVEAGLPYGTMYGNILATSVDQLSTDASGQVLNSGLGGTPAEYSVNRYGHVVKTADIGTSAEAPAFLYDEEASVDHVGVIGNTNPDFNFGISTNLNWKNIGLYILADWQQGGDIYNYTKQLLYFNERHVDLQHFGADGTHYNYANFIYNKSNPTNAFVEDGTFLKIREISLDYTLYGEDVNSNFFDSIRFALSGRNLWTFTDYTGWDPEVAINTNPTNFRLDEFAYPNLRNYSFSVEFKF